MKLRSVSLDQDGIRSHLRLADLSPGLNLVQGPEGSGKHSLIECIAWVLCGEHAVSSQFRAARGSIELTTQDGSAYSVTRHARHVQDEPLVISSSTDPQLTRYEALERTVEGLSPEDYHGFVMPPQDNAHGLDPLLRQVERLSRELSWLPVDSNLQALLDREREVRAQLDQSQKDYGSLAALRDQRHVLQRQLQALQDRRSTSHDRSGEDDCRSRDRRLALQGRIERVNQLLDRVSTRIADHQRGRQDVTSDALSLSGQIVDRLRMRSNYLARQIERCERVVDHLRQARRHDDSRYEASVHADHESLRSTDYLIQALDSEIQGHVYDMELEAEILRTAEQDGAVPDEIRRRSAAVESVLVSVREGLPLLQAATRSSRDSCEGPSRLTDAEIARCAEEVDRILTSLRRDQATLKQALEQWQDGFEDFRSFCHGDLPVGTQWQSEFISRCSAAFTDRLIHSRALLLDFRQELRRQLADVESRYYNRERDSRYQHREADIRDTRRRIQRMDDQIAMLEQRGSLLQTQEEIAAQIARIRSRPSDERILSKANALLMQMTAGACRRVSRDAQGNVVVYDEHQQMVRLMHASAGLQSQVSLALRLAIAADYRGREQGMPLIISDVLVKLNAADADRTARVISEAAEQGQQILLFTPYEATVAYFSRFPASFYALRRTREIGSSSSMPIESRWPIRSTRNLPSTRRAWPWPQDGEPRRHETVGRYPAPQQPVPPSRPQTIRRVANVPSPGDRLRFYLDLGDPVVDAPSIGPRSAERLQKVGVCTVGQLLEGDAADLALRLNQKRMNASTIQLWQDQARLACQIPYLRGHDAQILVGCGLLTGEAIAGLDPESLWNDVRDFLTTGEGRRIIRGGTPPDQSEVRDWVAWAGQARRLETV